MLSNPLPAGEPENDAAIEPALRTEVQVFDARVDAEARELEAPREPPIGARGFLAFEQQREALLEAELRQVGQAALFIEGLGHARETEAVEECECLLNQHESDP
jgi:hypothetical protein